MIIICESLTEKKIETIVKQCQTVRMFAPYENDVRKVIKHVCDSEGVFWGVPERDAILHCAGQDMRKATILCQFSKRTVRKNDEADLFLMSAFDSLSLLTKPAKLTYDKCMEICARQEDAVTLLQHENYPVRVAESDLSTMADVLSTYDVINAHPMHHTHTVAAEFCHWGARTHFLRSDKKVDLNRSSLFPFMAKRKTNVEVYKRISASVNVQDLSYMMNIIDSDATFRGKMLEGVDRTDVKVLKNRFK